MNKAPELIGQEKNQILEDFEEVMEIYLKRGKQIFSNNLKLNNFI